MNNNSKKNILFFSLAAFLAYTVITLLIFYHRIPNITTQYAMPDVDTDGGLWYQWFLYFINKHHLTYDVITLAGYPFGYDISLSPASNLIYSIQVFILENILGFSWSNLILVTNISSLITYPLSALGGMLLCYYLTKNKSASFIAGLIFSFSFYHIYMGRGQMSINHIEFIPFYFLSLFYYLNKKSFFSLLLSALLFSFMFMADAYYAFFSGIFSVIIISLADPEPFRIKAKTFFSYYSILFIVLLLVNFNFVLSNLYLFNSEQAAQTGRNSLPKNELTNILYYFSPLPFNLLYYYIPQASYFLYNLTFFIAIAGLIFIKNNRLYVTFLLCFLVSIVLSAYIPSLFWINILYFNFFGMFRGVGRLALPGYLFLGLTVGLAISWFMRSSVYKRINRPFRIFLFFMLSTTIILAGLNVDETWMRNTDFSKIAKLYQPVRDNPNISSIAAYPMNLNFNGVGFPQPYQLLGQIIHKKPYANGANFSSPQAIAYQKKISNINNKETIDILRKYGVNTIMIYNNLLENSKKINNTLKEDERVSFIGRYIQSRDVGYVSANDLSRDISLYEVKNTVNIKQNDKRLLFSPDSNTEITYKKISAYEYIITASNINSDFSIVFDSPYSNKWQLLKGDKSNKNNISFLFSDSNAVGDHQKYNEYANKWTIKKNGLYLSKEDTRNSIDKSSAHFTLFFKPYASVTLGNMISYSTIIGITIYLISFMVKHKIKNAKKK